tara:strand:+ start:384 stop:554 length:171 start_codon:yes stop_codon:yes gene_type:complete
MTDTIAVIFGMTFVGIILVCLIGTLLQCMFSGADYSGKRNKKLLDNMNKIKDKKWN